MSFQISSKQVDPDITVVNLNGQLSLGFPLTQAEEFFRNLLTQGPKKVVLELSDLHYVDSAGLGTLAQAATNINKAGGKTCFAAAGPRVARILQITHVERVVPVHPDLASAVRSFSS